MSKKKKRAFEEAAEFDRKNRKEHVNVNAMTQGQKKYIVEVNNNTITLCTGPAGCGKTAIAVGLALQNMLSNHPTYEKLVILRPAKEACDEHIGYLPGDLSEKMGPWGAPIMDNMAVFVGPSTIKNLFYDKKVEIIPLAYARGRSLNKSFIIVDEAQNCSQKQMFMVLTRIGNGSKMVINGDLDQSDSFEQVNGLSDAIAKLRDMSSVSVVELTGDDIVRNPLISEITKRYGK